MFKQFGSQTIEVLPPLKCMKTHINSPFNTAGKMFNWVNEEAGVGLSVDIVRYAVLRNFDIILTIGDDTSMYMLSGEKWMELSSPYHVSGKDLLVVPLSSLEAI